MRVALVSPYSWTYPGGVTRHIEALRGELDALGHHVRVLAPLRPRHARDRARAPRDAPAGARAARLADPARPDARLGVERRGLEPERLGARREAAAQRAARRRLRRRPRARARDAADRVGRDGLHRAADGGDVPLLLREPRAARDRRAPGRAPPAQPPHRADRRLRGRGLDRQALLRRRVPDRPQRRVAARRRRPRAAAARAAASRCGSPSSARRSSARACPCCCAPSRRCASTSPSS